MELALEVVNFGPGAAQPISLEDDLPQELQFVSITAPGWTCTAPALGATGIVSCDNPSFPVGSQVLNLIVRVSPSAPLGQVTNTAQLFGESGVDITPGDTTATAVVAVVPPGIPTLSGLALLALAVLLGSIGALILRRAQRGAL